MTRIDVKWIADVINICAGVQGKQPVSIQEKVTWYRAGSSVSPLQAVSVCGDAAVYQSVSSDGTKACEKVAVRLQVVVLYGCPSEWRPRYRRKL